MPNQFYKPKKEEIGPDVGYSNNRSDVKYRSESRKNEKKKRIKVIYYIFFIVSFLLLAYFVLR